MSYDLTRRIESLERIFLKSSKTYEKPRFTEMTEKEIDDFIRLSVRNFSSKDELIEQMKILLEDSKPLQKELREIASKIINEPESLDKYFS